MSKRFFHEISREEFEVYKKNGWTWEDINKNFVQPTWCNMAFPLEPMGCWSLISFRVTSKEVCKNCESFQDHD